MDKDEKKRIKEVKNTPITQKFLHSPAGKKAIEEGIDAGLSISEDD